MIQTQIDFLFGMEDATFLKVTNEWEKGDGRVPLLPYNATLKKMAFFLTKAHFNFPYNGILFSTFRHFVLFMTIV